MSGFIQATALVLVSVILSLVIGKRNGELAVVLSVAVCALVGILAMRYWKAVMDFSVRLQTLGKLDTNLIGPLWKVVGIAVVSEISSMICADAGNSAMGKALQLLAGAVILYLSIPLLTAMLELLQDILGSI